MGHSVINDMFAKYFLLSFPLTSVGLGAWQLKRLEWKKGLIAKLEERLHEEPLDLLKIKSTEDLSTFEYRPFKVRGRFDQDASHQIYLKPRLLVVNREAVLRGRSAHQSNVGANIVSAFQIDGTDLRILVNRGWLDSKGKDSLENSADIGLGPPDRSIDLVGILRNSDKRATFGINNNITTKELHVRDVETMSKILKTAPIYLEADESLSPGRGPIGGQTQANVRNEHLNYAITWFSLAAFSYFMWYTKYGKRRFTPKLISR